ncbi:MAG: 2-C-methyl-D-erythritol 4-phosphate cytidylyltransferase [Solirubrobacteraceae bacterium]|jgi:2-C-methyl-D-erythritol 4-phosphate cytidylyltransferase|nr:2-C-methyl-D-erythritol 4-phosphate cytidylyltransferase [Solirubrobacteraceae bacterium]
MSVVGIIPAAGSGERLGSDGPKAFVVVGGRPLLDWSVDVLSAVCSRVVVAVPEGHEGEDRIRGGAVRSESVRLALEAAPEASVVVVHDAARPLVSVDLVRECIAALDGVDGAIAAAPMTDTVKEAGESGVVERTLDRGRLWRVQTPQVFRADVLRRALDVSDDALAAATDDAALVEAAGGTIRVVEAPADNIKVTRAVDLALAELLLAERKS